MKRTPSGMTLVEVMVAMGLTIVMSLGLAQVMTFTARSVKSSSLSADWINLLQTIRLAISQPEQCVAMMGFLTNNTANPLPPNTVLATRTAGQTLNLFNNATPPVPVSTLLRIGPPAINNLTARTIQVVVAPGNVTQPIRIGGVDSLMDLVQLNLEVDKTRPDGTVDGVGATRLATNASNSITFNIVRNRTTGAFSSCFGTGDAVELACNEMGGTRSASAATDPRCQLSRLFLGFGGAGGPPNQNTPAGQRIQLFGTHGTRSDGDLAIGVDGASTLWLNTGVAGGVFRITDHRGSNDLLRITGDPDIVDNTGPEPNESLAEFSGTISGVGLEIGSLIVARTGPNRGQPDGTSEVTLASIVSLQRTPVGSHFVSNSATFDVNSGKNTFSGPVAINDSISGTSIPGNPPNPLNIDGGARVNGTLRADDVRVDGAIKLGYVVIPQVYTTVCSFPPPRACVGGVTINCPANSVVLGGGYKLRDSDGITETVRTNEPSTNGGNGWTCESLSLVAAQHRCWAICARLQDD